MSAKSPFPAARGAPRVKICCISTEAEAALAVNRGAAALGLVGRMPSGPGVIDDETIRRVAAAVPAGVLTFLLTAETQADAIVAHHARARTTTIQLVDAVAPDVYPVLRAALPGVGLVQVIHVEDESCVERARSAAAFVDALLLDSGSTKKAVKELGGTGRVHDWSLSRRIVEASAVPVFLAGGLSAANAAEAIARVRPYGLDVCTGVRTDGRLDADKLARFMTAAGN